jgi:hypothetical protein
MVGAIITSFLSTTFVDEETSSFTAKNMRFQIIISSAFSLFTSLAFMTLIVPPEFTMGKDDFPTLHKEGGTNVKIMGCGVLGLLANIALIILFEFILLNISYN